MTLETIVESITNGQRRQALEQLSDSKYLLEDLFQYLLELNQPQEIITMYRVAVNTNYITFGD